MLVGLEWGPVGAEVLAQTSDVVVVVDVLSFTTAVSVAVERGASVWPHPGGEDADRLARELGAELAGPRGTGGLSLSPASLGSLGPGAQLVLPSPNGSTVVAALAGRVPVVAASLRNAAAVARHLRGVGRVGLVPAGERWGDGTLRPAYEDHVGAGAVADRLTALAPSVVLTPEAEAAALAFRSLRPLTECPSGEELVGKGYAEDVRLAGQVDVSAVVPLLVDGRLAPTTAGS